mmetsp:Transcript_9994/g.21990  ORF Transcript_9994/g.21990 Transcript_9994/m.21990 type:complete len:788 (-) Transcript_9994:107-2470(-)
MSRPRSSLLLGSAFVASSYWQARALDGPSNIGWAGDITQCIGFDVDSSLILQDCLEGAGVPWQWSATMDEIPGPLMFTGSDKTQVAKPKASTTAPPSANESAETASPRGTLDMVGEHIGKKAQKEQGSWAFGRRLAEGTNYCANGVTMKVEVCDGSDDQNGWSWSVRTLQISRAGKCLKVSSGMVLTWTICPTVPDRVSDNECLAEQNGRGTSDTTWVLMPVNQPHADVLDQLVFPLRTSGRYVVDATGLTLKLVGVNWVGAHLKPMVNFGLDILPVEELMKIIRHMGFNHVRISYALSMLHHPGQPMPKQSGPFPKIPPSPVEMMKMAKARGGDFPPLPNENSIEANPEWEGLSAMEVFDRTVKAATDEGLLVILNNHMSTAGWCCNNTDGSGIWYNEDYTDQDWFDALEFISKRFMDNPRVFAHDLRNEVRPDFRDSLSTYLVPFWGVETSLLEFLGYKIVDWRRGASQGAVAVWKGNPEMNVVVEGVWYASNLAYAQELPLGLDQDCLKSRLFYSLHEYTWYAQLYLIWQTVSNPFQWHQLISDLWKFSNDEDSEEHHVNPDSIPYEDMDYDRYYKTHMANGYDLLSENESPMWVSEFGSCRRYEPWYNNTMKFFKEMDVDWCWWLLDPEKMPPNWVAEGDPGQLDPFGVFDTAARNFKAVVGWKLQDLILAMAVPTDRPERVEVPPACEFEYEPNKLAADAETNNFDFLRMVDWSWWAALFAALVVLIVGAPIWITLGLLYYLYIKCCRLAVVTREPPNLAIIDEEEGESLIKPGGCCSSKCT